MIETASLTHTTRLFAECTKLADIFWPTAYFSYQGDIAQVPWYFKKGRGESAQTDLTEPMEALMARMKSNTRNEIRRAEKAGCSFERVTDIDEFIEFYNAFCASKGLNDFVDRARLAKYKNLLLAKSVCEGKVLAMHATLLDPVDHIAVLILSCSQRLDEGVDRKLIGWGNRFLHYKELEFLKQEGYEKYDWSGVVTDPKSPLYSIGQFKLAFGGTVVDSWTLYSPLYILMHKAMQWLRKVRQCIKVGGCHAE